MPILSDTCRRCVCMGAITFSICGAPARNSLAQGPVETLFVAPHTGVVFCESRRVRPADSAAFLYRFEDQPNAFARKMSIAFDSAGSPLYLTLVTADAREERVTAVWMRFVPALKGTYREATSVKGATGDSAKATDSEVTDEAARRALELAKTMWQRRCPA
jgi:hypothetical protein